MTEPVLPLSVEEISPGWLGGALAERFPGVRVREVRVDDAHAGTTGRALLRPVYERPAGLPVHVFAKLPPEDEAQRAFVAATGMGRREARFYRELAGSVPVRVPDCYHADWNEAGDRYVMLLENLPDSGCTFRNASSFYSIDYVRAVLMSFARLHAAFWDSPRFAGELAWVTPPARHEMGPRLVSRALEQYAGEMPPVFEAMGRLYVEHCGAVHDVWESGVPTLVHGDVHDGNLFWSPPRAGGETGAAGLPPGEPGLLDWAIVSRLSGLRDVAYFMAGTLKTEDRHAREKDLLEEYRLALRRAGAEIGGDELWSQYCLHVPYVWVAAVTTLAMGSAWQPVNYVMRSMERLNRALEDCGSVAALAALVR